MASKTIILVAVLGVIAAIRFAKIEVKVDTHELETYIIELRYPHDRQEIVELEELESWYNTFLPTTATKVDEKPQLVYAYRHVLNGFAAKLTDAHAKEIREKDGVISVQPERILSLDTTRSPNFLGLHQSSGFWKDSNYGKGIIIGVLDSGTTPGHPSFHDRGVPPPPAKWNGTCNVTGCNNKLIGLRNYTPDPPVDEDGHGTHTSSIAAGNFVEGAAVNGEAHGTASGIAPLAHVAMYKVCNETGCREIDILAGMDKSIDDGVDVLSISMTIDEPSAIPFYSDFIAKGVYAAIQKGIFVSCSAGNNGSFYETVRNGAPWILTVGASTIDRKVKATVKLGNGALLDGESLYQPKDFPQTFLPLVFPGINGDVNASFCAPGSLNNTDVKGKVVICQRGGVENIDKGRIVKDAGGAAMIITNMPIHGATTEPEIHVLPASHVGYKDGIRILEYLLNSILNSTSPVAGIVFGGTVIGDKTAPQVAYFSSRGPNSASPGILKPDIIGPGVSIIAAWNQSVDNTTTAATFNIISGTSMSCPHLCGIAALLKVTHPDWSPAAIKSAIMTTADLINGNNQPIQDERELPASLFAIGAGHVNPSKANHPGLIYDIQPDDYIPYLCGLRYSDQEVTSIVHKPVSCSNVSSIPEAQLNYPSFAITLSGNVTKTYTRTVTNVGDAISTYTVKNITTPGVIVEVKPSTLIFSEVDKKISYNVTFTPAGIMPGQFVEGALEWNSSKYLVRIPIYIKYVFEEHGSI